MRLTMRFIILFTLAISCLSLGAQSSAREFKTVKYEEKVYDHPDYKLYLAGSFARAEIMKVKIRVFNKSKHVIYIKPEEIQFMINDKTFNGHGKLICVQPDGNEMQVVEIKGNMDMRCEKFDVVLAGFYKVDPKTGEAVKAEPTEVDGSSATPVTASPLFKCNTTIAQSNKEKSFAKYSCLYSGDKIGVIEPGNTVAIMSSGKQNFNSFPRNEIFILEKDIPQTITIEFRKLNGVGDLTDGYKVLWDNVFKTCKAEAYEIKKTTVNMDVTKSE